MMQNSALSCRSVPRCSVPRPTARLTYSKGSLAGTAMPTSHLRTTGRNATRRVTTMGLFGLGVPELAVIAGVVALIYGEWVLGAGLDVAFPSARRIIPPQPAADCVAYILHSFSLQIKAPESCQSWAKDWARRSRAFSRLPKSLKRS
jgi:hypothetical protein